MLQYRQHEVSLAVRSAIDRVLINFRSIVGRFSGYYGLLVSFRTHKLVQFTVIPISYPRLTSKIIQYRNDSFKNKLIESKKRHIKPEHPSTNGLVRDETDEKQKRRPRLEFYEQACAVDVVTKGCAEPPSICRRAVLDILGTELRTTCSCRGSDLAALYDCLEWQRLLWLNPCVGKRPSNACALRPLEASV